MIWLSVNFVTRIPLYFLYYTINGIKIIRATQNIYEKVRKYLFIFTKRTIKIFTINVQIIDIFTLIFLKKHHNMYFWKKNHELIYFPFLRLHDQKWKAKKSQRNPKYEICLQNFTIWNFPQHISENSNLPNVFFYLKQCSTYLNKYFALPWW